MSPLLKGAYILFLRIPEPNRVVRVGKLGTYSFPGGTYAYVGSALSGLESRVHRHFSRAKRTHWHIDYLLCAGEAIQAILVPNENRMECVLNRVVGDLPGSRSIVKGFGSSDCSCHSHLHLIPSRSMRLLENLSGAQLWMRG
ncbi:MAG: GIY-YIG nuclease family protein [Methanomassiliicoccales archaeon]|jgi:Uri superfamily endonuclease